MHPATEQHPAPPRDATYTVADAAPLLGMGVHELFRWLRAKNYCVITQSGTVPQTKYIRAGYFKMKTGIHLRGSVKHYNASTVITTRGMVWLQQQIKKETAKHE